MKRLICILLFLILHITCECQCIRVRVFQPGFPKTHIEVTR